MIRRRQINKIKRLDKEAWLRAILTHKRKINLSLSFDDIPWIPKYKLKRVKSRMHRKYGPMWG